jgi:hypothetical protein
MQSELTWLKEGGVATAVSDANPLPTRPHPRPAEHFASEASAIIEAGTPVVVFPAGSITSGARIKNLWKNRATLIVNCVDPAGVDEGGTNFGLAPGDWFDIGPTTNAVTANSTALIAFSAMRW